MLSPASAARLSRRPPFHVPRSPHRNTITPAVPMAASTMDRTLLAAERDAGRSENFRNDQIDRLARPSIGIGGPPAADVRVGWLIAF